MTKEQKSQKDVDVQDEKITCCRPTDYLSHKQSVFRQLHKKYSFHCEK